MCGIAGIYNLSEPIDSAPLSILVSRLGHRGPDDSGVHRCGRVGLAQTRLSIIDLQGGHQPIVDIATGVALVANGEIYNFVELREELKKDGVRFTTESDSEVILRGYLAQGRDYVRRLHGMFAFAIHDPRSGDLLLGRDRLGIKPLYYSRLPGRILFASELKAILPLLPHRPEVEPVALLEFLQNQFNTGETTMIRGIHRLLPGETAVVDGKLSLQREKYWSALDVRPRSLTMEEAEEEFSELFDQVMREHMRSDVPLGLFLSGGLDSGVLLAMLTRHGGRSLRTFSVGFKDAALKDESVDAAFIAGCFGSDHLELLLDREAVFRRLPHVVWATDDLLRDYACLPTSILAEKASRELKVVFSGEGGDEAFAGYGRYRPAWAESWVKSLLRPGSGGFRSRGQWQWASEKVFGPELRRLKREWHSPVRRHWQETPASWSPIMRRQYIDLCTNLPDDLLVKADRTLMSFGLEGRVPFLDHRIVEFGLSLPDALKIRSVQGKYFLKKWAEQYIPAEHIYRRKRGFHVPIGEWLTGGFIVDLEKKILRNPAVGQWFALDGVRSLFAAKRNGKNVNREIWCLLQFAIWHRLFIDKPVQIPSTDENPLDWIG